MSNQFDKLGGDYYNVPGGHVHRYYTEQKVNVLAEYVTKTDNCLDVGCGVGLHARMLSDLTGCRVNGLDSSQGMVDGANESIGESFAVRADATNLPYCDGAFDVSYMVNVTHHLIKPIAVEKAISEMSRVSRKRVFVFEFNPLNPFCKYVLFKICPYDNGDERIPSKREVVADAIKAGLIVREVRHISYMPMFCPKSLMGVVSRVEPVLERLVPWFTVGLVYILDKPGA